MNIINPLERLKEVKSHHAGGTARMIARYIAYKPEYSQTPYLHTITFPTRKYKKHFIFNLRLYSVNTDGAPGEPVYDEPILVNIPADKKEISVDISSLNIKMPENGLFIVVEKYLIRQNISGTVYKKVIDDNGKLIPEEKREYMYDFYGPVIICEHAATDKEGWVYHNGKWNNQYHIQVTDTEKKTSAKGIFAVEVTLSD